ncbi:hypothetical protein I552_0671 [Mycobacterium xenopi 3993]|nr:hypothetical protein I552_0671 [Mycobacterium xenopi 3993]
MQGLPRLDRPLASPRVSVCPEPAARQRAMRRAMRRRRGR